MRRRRVIRKSRRGQNTYQRTFYIRRNLVTSLTGATVARQTINIGASVIPNVLIAQFQKYRLKKYGLTVRPRTQLDSAQFALQTQQAPAWTVYDPYGRINDSTSASSANIEVLGNNSYAKRHSPRFIRRGGMPQVIRGDTNTGVGNYSVTRSPWINSTAPQVEHYLTTVLYPQITGADSETAVELDAEIWITVEFSGRAYPIQVGRDADGPTGAQDQNIGNRPEYSGQESMGYEASQAPHG